MGKGCYGDSDEATKDNAEQKRRAKEREVIPGVECAMRQRIKGRLVLSALERRERS